MLSIRMENKGIMAMNGRYEMVRLDIIKTRAQFPETFKVIF